MSEQKCLGQASFIVLLVLLVSFKIAVGGSAIKFLPGFEGPLPFELETGYIGVGETEEVQLFYYFVKSESNPLVDPVVLWMTGGPGCTSLTALAYEFGPIKFEEVDVTGSFPRLVLNPNSWTEMASFIFLDTPVGTGFSYATGLAARKSNTILACNEVHQFLRKFLVDHPEFISNPVYVGGDSFSGLIVPVVAELISEGNEQGVEPPINFKGYLLGNPTTIPTDNNYLVPFAHGMGLVSEELYESLKRNCKGNFQNIDPSNLPCWADLMAFFKLMNNINIVHILEPTCNFDGLSDGSVDEEFPEMKMLKKNWCRDHGYLVSDTWANDDTVREVLHIPKGSVGNWRRCNYGVPFTTTVRDCVPYHANLSSKGYRSLIYSGDHDTVVPYLATESWVRSLNYSIVDDWRQWLVQGQVAGYTRTYANQMTFATVKGGGHTAPEYKPVECKAMFKRWISHCPL